MARMDGGGIDWGALLAQAGANTSQPTGFSSWMDAFQPRFVGGSTNDLSKGAVYLGSTSPSKTFHDVSTDEHPFGFTTKGGATRGEIASYDAALNLPALWSDEELQKNMERLRSMGYKVDNWDDFNTIWKQGVDRAAQLFNVSEGKKKVTPWDALAMYSREGETNGQRQGFTGTKTRVDRTVSDIDEGEAWSTIRSALSQMLGRDPDDDEVRDFTYRMNSLAAQNPSISKTIAHFKNGDLVSTNTHSAPGFTSADMAREAFNEAQADPDYAEYQAATTYYNAALNALGALGSV